MATATANREEFGIDLSGEELKVWNSSAAGRSKIREAFRLLAEVNGCESVRLRLDDFTRREVVYSVKLASRVRIEYRG